MMTSDRKMLLLVLVPTPVASQALEAAERSLKRFHAACACACAVTGPCCTVSALAAA